MQKKTNSKRETIGSMLCMFGILLGIVGILTLINTAFHLGLRFRRYDIDIPDDYVSVIFFTGLAAISYFGGRAMLLSLKKATSR